MAARTAASTSGCIPSTKYSLGHADAQAPHIACQARRHSPAPARPPRSNRGDRSRRWPPSRTASVGHAAGKGADLVQRRGKGHQPPAADPAVGGLDADDAAQGRRLAHAAARIGAQGAKGQARRHRGRAAAAGAARHAAQIPGIVRGKIGRVLGGRAHGELVGVGLAQDHRPGGPQFLNDGGAKGRHIVLQDARAAGSGQALDADDVLDGQGDAQQRVVLAGRPAPVCLGGLFQGQLGSKGQIGLDLVVQGQNAVQTAPESARRTRTRPGATEPEPAEMVSCARSVIRPPPAPPAPGSSPPPRSGRWPARRPAAARAATSSSRMTFSRGRTVAVGGMAAVSSCCRRSA